MQQHGGRFPSRRPVRRTRAVKATLAIVSLACALSVVSVNSAAPAQRVVQTQSSPAPFGVGTVSRSATRTYQDVIVAGGLDGRVYAINAWTGDTLWTFDSGGPMVDSSSCWAASNHQQQQQQQQQRPHGSSTQRDHESDDTMETERLHTARVTTAADDAILEASEFVDERSIIETRRQSAEVAAASAAVLAELVPSYDGRLYHMSKSRVKELEMTMIDIINANGPIRLADSGSDNENLSDIILFGEKKTEIFALDAADGLIQPYYPVSSASSPVVLSSAVLFGRAEFTTRAVHARNSSSTRCFKVAEYFLQFTAQPRCSKVDDDATRAEYVPPEILVLPKDPSASDDDEGSTIAAYDPLTSKQLWEVEIPHFDVLAVYGISATRGATFYQWNVDGPSSRALARREDLALSANAANEQASTTSASLPARQQLARKPSSHHHRLNDANARSKQLARVASRSWGSLSAQLRMRLMGEKYYLESGVDDGSNLSGSEKSSSSATPFDPSHMDDLFEEGLAHTRKRRVFWEPIVNDGKRGVFITYYHVGAMMVGITVGCLLIAWGCYVKGLSASLAHSAIKSMDGNQFFMSHVHQLTIERPGEESITISSVIGRPLLMSGLDGTRSLPLLENGEPATRQASGVEVDIDPATEAELMERFARVAAIEAASALTRSTYSVAKATLLELEYDASDSDAGATTESSALVVRSHGVSSVQTSSSTRVLALMSGFDADASSVSESVVHTEARARASIVELDSSLSSEDTSESGIKVLPKEASAGEEETIDETQAIDGEMSVDSSAMSSWSSDMDSRGSSSDNENTSTALDASVQSSAQSSDSSSSQSDSASKQRRKGSDASSSDSSHANEAEVLFPFVCQSRFANEFEEISAIGKGGFGQVILAENRLDGRKYAIKRVGLHLKNQTSKTLQKFLREVKILALLDHPNIVRYYQAWLEKVEEGSATGLFGAPSDGVDSSLTGAPGRNYSMSNLLAPITELEFSENQRHQSDFYSDSGAFNDDDDEDDGGGFEWERDSSAGAGEGQAWREEDLVQSNVPRRRHPRDVVAPNKPAKESATDDDLSLDKCDHWLYIQMQYCAGRNLGDYLALPNRSMHLPKLLKIFVQIASALAHVHSCGLIHRDLKPANIFVADTDGDSIKLGDFGLSRYAANVNLNGPASSTAEEHQQQLTAAVSTSTTHIANGHHIYSSSVWSVSMSNVSENEVTAGVGTYLYASPEQVAGKKYNAKTDVYSLGMILFELCHERFTTTMERYIALRNARENTLPPEFRWNKQSPELMAMIAKLLSHDPAARPSADEVVKWGQELYELSLSQQTMSALRSPLHPPRLFNDASMPSFDLMGAAAAQGESSSAFAFHVEAKAEPCSSSSGDSGSSCGERRLPNHNLLKEICDVIARVGQDRVEIKKCGLQLQDGVQILEFVLDAPFGNGIRDGDKDLATTSSSISSDLSEYCYDPIVCAIEALPDVEQVRRVGS